MKIGGVLYLFNVCFEETFAQAVTGAVCDVRAQVKGGGDV